LGWRVVSGLHDRDAVEGGVELSVAAAVEAVAACGLAGAAGDRCGSAEASEGGGVAEAADVACVRDKGRGDLWAGAVQVGDWVAILLEEPLDFSSRAAMRWLRSSMSRARSRMQRLATCSTRPSPKLIRFSRRSSRWRLRLTTSASPTGST
jgi:hypothetical protein